MCLLFFLLCHCVSTVEFIINKLQAVQTIHMIYELKKQEDQPDCVGTSLLQVSHRDLVTLRSWEFSCVLSHLLQARLWYTLRKERVFMQDIIWFPIPRHGSSGQQHMYYVNYRNNIESHFIFHLFGLREIIKLSLTLMVPGN